MLKRHRHVCVLVIVAAMTMLTVFPAAAQVAEAQRLLNAMSLDAGPADGVAGPKTLKAWQTFLAHRGLPVDTPIDAESVVILRGQTKATMPRAEGLDLRIVGGRFPSIDSYQLDPHDPSKFCVILKPGDYDTVDYRDSGSAMERQPGFPLRKQRAKITGQDLLVGRTYTADFELMADNALGGVMFQVHRSGSGGAIFLSGTPNSLIITAGDELQNVPAYWGDWVGRWLKLRFVFHPSPDGDSWVRIYVDGTQTLDTSDRNPHFPMKAAFVTFGAYRGNVATPTTVCFRNISLSEGDLGAP
jgi:hypothetical protein